jgi:hypothetical protein
MNPFWLRAVARLGSWAIGLLVAARVVPYVSLSVSGFVVAVVVFSVVQTPLSWLILKLPQGYAMPLLGFSGLTMTLIAIGLAAAFNGLSIGRFPSFVAMTLVVWLVTTVGAILLPEVYTRREVGST